MRFVMEKTHFWLMIIFTIALMIPLQKSDAQIIELEQKIFGMDCAPCAKGVEVRMERMDGVIGAELNLNRGEAHLVFTDSHTTSLSQLHRSIVEGGFSPKTAQIKIRGILHREGRQWRLVTDAGDTFLLKGIDAGQLSADEETQVTIEGAVAERSDEEFWQLSVQQIHTAG